MHPNQSHRDLPPVDLSTMKAHSRIVMSAAPCDDDRCVIAHHDAGHAVVTHALRGPIASVTIIPTTERLGCVWARTPTPEMMASTVDADIAATVDFCARARALLLLGKSRAPGAALYVDAIDRSIILLAGPMAEQKLTGVFDAAVARADLAEAHAHAGAIAISPEAAWQFFVCFAPRRARWWINIGMPLWRSPTGSMIARA